PDDHGSIVDEAPGLAHPAGSLRLPAAAAPQQVYLGWRVALRDVREQLHQRAGVLGLEAYRHAGAVVQHQVELHRPLGLVEPRVEAAGAGVDAPVDVTQLVTGLVRPEVVELDALARLA